MKKSNVSVQVLAVLLLVAAFTGCLPAGKTSPAIPDVLVVGNTYTLGLSFVGIKFKVIELPETGWIKVQAEDDATAMGLRKGEEYWLNVSQISLIGVTQ